MDAIFKSLLKSMAKTADNITRALRLKWFHGSSVPERSAGFMFYLFHLLTGFLGISTVLCPSASHPRGSSSCKVWV